MNHEWSREELADARRCKRAVYHATGEKLSVQRMGAWRRRQSHYLVKVGVSHSFLTSHYRLLDALDLLAHVANMATFEGYCTSLKASTAAHE
jgi:hypothetical protein